MFQSYIIPNENRKAPGHITRNGFLKQSVLTSLNKTRPHHSRTVNYFEKGSDLLYRVTLVNVGRVL